MGITAFSHAAIGQLLREVVKHAGQGSGLRIIQKADEDDWCGDPAVDRVDNREVDARLAAGTVDIVAGTPWLWSRPALEGTLDTLVVDEAGQISLANLAAIGRVARNLVLLGDPQQLSQPVKGAHPPGAEKSALEQVLGAHQAIPPDRGVFLGTTRRLHPAICAFTSELFYEGQLGTLAGLEHQAVLGDGGLLAGSGLRWIPVDHTGRASVAPEEVEVVSACVSGLLARDWRNRDGAVTRLLPRDVLVVSPYNAQVARLRRSPAGGRPRRDRGQVPGPGGARRHLLDGHLDPGRHAPRHVLPVQPQPVQRGDVPGASAGHPGLQPGAPHRLVPDAGADAAGEHAGVLRGGRPGGRE